MPQTPQSRGNEGFYEDESDEETDQDREEEDQGGQEEAGEGDENGEQKKTFITEFGVGDAKRKTSSARQHVKIESPGKQSIKENGELVVRFWCRLKHQTEISVNDAL